MRETLTEKDLIVLKNCCFIAKNNLEEEIEKEEDERELNHCKLELEQLEEASGKIGKLLDNRKFGDDKIIDLEFVEYGGNPLETLTFYKHQDLIYALRQNGYLCDKYLKDGEFVYDEEDNITWKVHISWGRY